MRILTSFISYNFQYPFQKSASQLHFASSSSSFFDNTLSPVSAAHSAGVQASTETLQAYQWPHPRKECVFQYF